MNSPQTLTQTNFSNRSPIEESPEEVDAQMEDIEPVASTSVPVPKKQPVPNGILVHNDSSVEMTPNHGLAQKGKVEAYIEYHPEPTTQINESPTKTQDPAEPTDKRPKSAGAPKNNNLKRANKVSTLGIQLTMLYSLGYARKQY